MSVELTQEVSSRLTSDNYGWLTTVAKSGCRVSSGFTSTVPSWSCTPHHRRPRSPTFGLTRRWAWTWTPMAAAEDHRRRGNRGSRRHRRRRPGRRTVLGEVQGARRQSRPDRGNGFVQRSGGDHSHQGVDDADGL